MANPASPYRAAPAQAPPVRSASAPFAPTLADASLGEVVFQGGASGRVHAPATGARLYTRLAIVPAIGIALIVGVGIAPNLLDRYDSDRTMVGCLFGGIFLVMGLFAVAVGTRSTRAAILLNTGRHADAEAIIRTWKGITGLLVGNLYSGVLASLRGDHAGALEHYQRLMAGAGRIGGTGLGGAAKLVGVTSVGPWGQRPGPQLSPAWLEAAFHAARALCNLGRVDEARQVLAHAGAPVGEYDALLRVVADRYADFCAGASTLGDAELRELTERALALRGTWGLLALCAWDWARRGDRATATRLLDEERARPNAARLPALMPRLAAWMAAPGL